MGRFIFAAFAGLVRRLPRKAALRLGAAIGSFLYSIAELTKYRGAIRMAEFPALYKKGLLAVDGLEHLAKAKEEGKGVIVLSAHMGNYELLLAFMGYLGYPMHIIGVKQSTDWFNEFIVGARELFGCKMLYHKEVTSAQVGEILARNEIVCLVADHHNYGGKARNIVNFFGKPVSVPAGPIAFSTRFGAQLVPAYTIREPGGRHRIIIEPPLQLIETGDAAADFQANCELYYQVYERWITQHPDQWMWSHERWAWLDENLQPKFA
ncbi:MAG: lysophospholipid acyltransferase family protein [Firmicutes bacterium]|nr:lysophospholipid acyltransferase family protein [Bacillota bacterium]